MGAHSVRNCNLVIFAGNLCDVITKQPNCWPGFTGDTILINFLLATVISRQSLQGRKKGLLFHWWSTMFSHNWFRAVQSRDTGCSPGGGDKP